MRLIGFLLASIISIPLFADSLVVYDNYEYGDGYRDSGGAYKAHPTGSYFTITRSESDARGYYHSSYGQTTVIAGQYNTATFSPFQAVFYRGSFSVYADSVANDPFGLGIPYSGGGSPISAGPSNQGFDLGDNTIRQGGFGSIFNPDFPVEGGLGNRDFVAFDSDGVPHLYSLIGSDGNWFLSDGSGLSVPVSDPSRIPVFYKDPDGALVSGYYDSSSGSFLDGGSSGGGSGEGGEGGDASSSVVEAINNQGQLTRAQLVALLGSSGSSWVYDCSLSLDQLYSLAAGQGLVTRPDIDLSGIQSSLSSIADRPAVNLSGIQSSLDAIANKPVVNLSGIQSSLDAIANRPSVNLSGIQSSLDAIDLSPLAKEVTLSAVRSRLDTWSPYIIDQGQNVATLKSDTQKIRDNVAASKNSLDSVNSILQSWDSSTVPSLPSPDFGNSSPDEELPFDASQVMSDGVQVLGHLTEWGQNGVPGIFDFDPISDLLTRMFGSIPSVGSDARMFSFDVDLPIIGHVHKDWSFSDIPFISEFRQFCLWLLYVFFGLAMFKTLHASIF